MTTMTKNRAGPVSIGRILQTMTGREHIPDAPPPPPPTAVQTLSQLDTSHDPKVATAVNAARAWQKRRRAEKAVTGGSFASLVLVAAKATREQAVTALGHGAKDKAIDDWIANRSGYGCGKTHIARCCLWSEAFLDGDQPVSWAGKFILASEIIPALDSGVAPGLWLGTAGIVVIDDVGAEGNIEYVSAMRQEIERHSRYTRLVDHCYRRRVSLIVTGNLTIDGLAAWVGGRAWSRLLEMAPAGAMLDMTGVPDYRRKVGGR